MADVKWIKITTDIFDDEKMYAIETQQDGQLMELIWFKLLCLAGKCNNHGFLMINNKIAYTDEMLSKIFRIELGSVQRALLLFEQLEMIEVVENAYMVANWDKHQNEQGLEDLRAKGRERTQRYRERQKQLKIERNLKLEEKSRCQYCGNEATGLDHIIPLTKGGTDTRDNVVPCCTECNRIKNNKSLVDFLNSNRERIVDELVLNNPLLQNHVCMVDNKYCDVTVTSQCDVNHSISISNSISTSISNNSNSDIDNNTKKDTKHKYGEYNHVLLTDKERERLVNDFGEEVTHNAIKYLDEYIEMKGAKYKNHNLAIRKWVIDAVTKKNKVTSTPQTTQDYIDMWANA